MPADASSLIPHGRTRQIPRLLERLAEVPNPRDPRGVRHALVAVLALTASRSPGGATSVLAVSKWIADAPPHPIWNTSA
ncbi:transposase family protein [Streptomyces sp. ND04-05B]|nr:transposase family protein [Streptomyces sp. ND04-05B]MDX3067608.1 transposase family protein [Streptomyces sp. ND04-05B]